MQRRMLGMLVLLGEQGRFFPGLGQGNMRLMSGV